MASLLQSKSPALSFSSTISSPSSLYSSDAAAAFPLQCKLPVVQSNIREIFMPALSSTMTEGKIVSWSKSEGDVLFKGKSVVVVESDKADMDFETFYSGILAAIVVNDGETAPVGAPIGILAKTEDEIAEAKIRAKGQSKLETSPAATTTSDVVAAAAPKVAPPDGQIKIVVTPYAKKLAKQHKVDINKVTRTGAFGRITLEDVEKAVLGI